MQRSARQSQARWIAGDNVRWYRGLPEKMGGYVERALTDTNGNRIWYRGHARTCHQWDSLDGQNWIAFGTEVKLYLLNNDRLYDITPIRATTTIVSGFSCVQGQLIVTVVDPLHGAQAGDFVIYSGASAFANVSLNQEWQIAGVIDLNTYTLALDVPASATVNNGGGTVVAQYDLTSGLTSDGTLTGFGAGTYGTQTYGTPRVGSTLGGTARIWSLDNWGEDLLASPNGEALYWWQRQTGADSRAVIRPNAPGNIERMLVGPDDRHVIALGTNVLDSSLTTVTGAQDRMFMRWCAGDDFDDWVETDVNDAGSKRLDLGSRLITACKTRTSVLIFSDQALYGLSLTGGTDVYSIQPLGAAVRIIGPNAAVDVGGIVFFMGQRSFYYYDGTLHDLPCDVADYVFGSADAPRLNRQMADKVTACVRLDFTEIRWHFPSVDADENDSVVIYNWTLQCWYVSSIARECALDVNDYYGTPVGFNDTGVYQDESGFDCGVEQPLLNYLQTWEGELQMTSRLDSGQTLMLWAASGGAQTLLLHSLIPDFKELTGTMTVQCLGRDRSGDALVYGDRLTCTASTEQLDPQFCQRRVAMYFENYEFGDFWRMDTWEGLATPYGRR
jgi:hypothetical protein